MLAVVQSAVCLVRVDCTYHKHGGQQCVKRGKSKVVVCLAELHPWFRPLILEIQQHGGIGHINTAYFATTWKLGCIVSTALYWFPVGRTWGGSFLFFARLETPSKMKEEMKMKIKLKVEKLRPLPLWFAWCTYDYCSTREVVCALANQPRSAEANLICWFVDFHLLYNNRFTCKGWASLDVSCVLGVILGIPRKFVQEIPQSSISSDLIRALLGHAATSFNPTQG